MKKNILLILIIVMILTTDSFSQESNRLTHFFNTAEQLREVPALLRIKKKVPERREEAELKLKDALDKAEELQKQNTLCDDGMVVYLKARSINATDAATLDIIEVLLRDIKSPAEEETLKIANNWIGCLFNPRRHSPFLQARTILPMRGSYYLPLEYDRVSTSAHLPFFPHGSSFVIPYQFKALGLYDKAWRSFFEGLDPFSFMNNDERSTEISVHWQEAADCAYRAGEKRLGWNLLMKAAVFGKEETFENVKEIARLWLDHEENGKPLPPPRSSTLVSRHDGKLVEYGTKEFEEYLDSMCNKWENPEARAIFIEALTPRNPRLRDAMLRHIGEPGLTEEEIRREYWDIIIDAYMKINAHPRAWALINEYPEEFENPEELKKKVQDDWLDLVGNLIQFGEFIRAKKVEVYGHILLQKISDDEDAQAKPSHGLLLRKDSEDENGNATFIYGYPIELREEGEIETGKATFRYPVAPLDVTIPWAFPEGSVEKAKQELRTILNEFRQAGEVSP